MILWFYIQVDVLSRFRHLYHLEVNSTYLFSQNSSYNETNVVWRSNLHSSIVSLYIEEILIIQLSITRKNTVF